MIRALIVITAGLGAMWAAEVTLGPLDADSVLAGIIVTAVVGVVHQALITAQGDEP